MNPGFFFGSSEDGFKENMVFRLMIHLVIIQINQMFLCIIFVNSMNLY